GKGHSQSGCFPRNGHEHLAFTLSLFRHSEHLDLGFLSQWRNTPLPDADRWEWKAKRLLQVVIPAYRLLLRAVGINSNLRADALLACRFTSPSLPHTSVLSHARGPPNAC